MATTALVTKADITARQVKPFRNSSRYLYFAVDDSFKWADTMKLTLEVRYFDAAKGELAAEFDGSDANAPFSGATRDPAQRSRCWETTNGRRGGSTCGARGC